MTCKDCVHSELCKMYARFGVTDLPYNDETICELFKNKANVVELPCVAMVEQFIKDGKFDEKLVAHNGKYAVVYIDKSKWTTPLIDITEQFFNCEKAKERIHKLKGGADNG